ncbi:MAG: winged helix-turn-helix transcriptional regulator [Candidatus Electrothrix sp. ATG1]|nr:winged helix-turn-helix transcriptional regulator [Candidatus Electrothrix sp. ATG1]
MSLPCLQFPDKCSNNSLSRSNYFLLENNQTLHQLFFMINLGERAGSGLPKILQFLTATPTMTIPELAGILNRSESAVGRAIRKLRQAEKLKRVGPAKGGYWRVL